MLIERKTYLEKLKRYKDKDLIKVITGVRRCGKSVLLFEIFYNELVKEGKLVKKENGKYVPPSHAKSHITK